MASSSQIPKGLHHLEHVHGSKFLGQWPSRLPHPSTVWVPPAQRIRKWNIRPDDRVRLLTGKPIDKYINESEGAKGGYKVYKVTSVDVERNKVFLEGLSVKRSSTTQPKPANYSSMSAEKRQEWDQEHSITPTSRPVHYSNIQLCVQEDGPNSIFASRIATDRSGFDKGRRRLAWSRYAAKLSGPSEQQPDADKGLVKIPWPRLAAGPELKPSTYDTAIDGSSGAVATQTSLVLPELETIWPTHSARLLSASRRSTLPKDQSVSNKYLDVASRSDPSVDALMPMYLAEELSPSFSRAKQTKAFNDIIEKRASKREAYAARALTEWEAAGRDRHLEGAMAELGLEGTKVRSRTRKEVREAALADFDAGVLGQKKAIHSALKVPKANRLAPGYTRKEKKAVKIERRLRRKQLEPSRNTVLPPTSS